MTAAAAVAAADMAAEMAAAVVGTVPVAVAVSIVAAAAAAAAAVATVQVMPTGGQTVRVETKVQAVAKALVVVRVFAVAPPVAVVVAAAFRAMPVLVSVAELQVRTECCVCSVFPLPPLFFLLRTQTRARKEFLHQ